MIKRNFNSMCALVLAIGVSFTSCSDDDDNDGGNDDYDSVTVYASNNSNGNISVYDFESDQMVETKTLITTTTAADGIYYDDDSESVFQASRSGNSLEGFANIDDLVTESILNINFAGTSDMSSPREVAVNGNLFVVADNADVDGDEMTPDGRLFIYSFDGSSFTLRNVITTEFKLWGITFNDNDLYAVVDATNELAVFNDFLSNNTDATVSASKRIAIEGIVRTHGITYDDSTDTLIMTDIGEASNGQDDGGFHIIAGFTNKFNAVSDGETMAVAGNQVRVSGASTLMGNPVDVAYDSDNEIIYIAEAGNGGGRILGFSNFTAGGDIAPTFNSALASASSVYLED
ncbi:hypothetical protein ITJ86_14305 [Winogradskyella sp. F6397]|uniref:Uncharacterized protein n=2 Tax=Flavobacteriaceae TaxID=49546 RepID=A0ABS0ENP4_9FLAO|nr:hypothetical protein [Winogradskyella marina]